MSIENESIIRVARNYIDIRYFETFIELINNNITSLYGNYNILEALSIIRLLDMGVSYDDAALFFSLETLNCKTRFLITSNYINMCSIKGRKFINYIEYKYFHD